MAEIKLFDSIDNTSRGHIGAGGQWMVWDDKYSAYRLVIPTETLPSIAGSQETVDNDVMTSLYVGKIAGKMTLDTKDFTFLHNRDDVMRIEELEGKNCKFLNMFADRTGREYIATISHREDDVNSSDKITDTITVTPSWIAPKLTKNVMDMVIKTNAITSLIDEETILNTSNSKTVYYDLTSEAGNASTYTCTSDNTAITCSIDNATDGKKKLKITTSSTTPLTGIVKVVATAEGYADWFVTTLVYANY